MSEEERRGLDVTIAPTDGGMVLRWVLVAEAIAPDGTESLWVKSTDGLKAWTQLGLFRFAAALIESEPC